MLYTVYICGACMSIVQWLWSLITYHIYYIHNMKLHYNRSCILMEFWCVCPAVARLRRCLSEGHGRIRWANLKISDKISWYNMIGKHIFLLCATTSHHICVVCNDIYILSCHVILCAVIPLPHAPCFHCFHVCPHALMMLSCQASRGWHTWRRCLWCAWRWWPTSWTGSTPRTRSSCATWEPRQRRSRTRCHGWSGSWRASQQQRYSYSYSYSYSQDSYATAVIVIVIVILMLLYLLVIDIINAQ